MRKLLYITVAISATCLIAAERRATIPEVKCPERLVAAAPKFPRGVLHALRRFNPELTPVAYREALDQLFRFSFGFATYDQVYGTPFFRGARSNKTEIERFIDLAAAGDKETMLRDLDKDYDEYIASGAWRNGRNAHAGLREAPELVAIVHPGTAAQEAFIRWIAGQPDLAKAPRIGLLHFHYTPISRALAAELTDVIGSDGGEHWLRRLGATRVHTGGDYLAECVTASIRGFTVATTKRNVEILVHGGWTTVHTSAGDRLYWDVREEYDLKELDEEIAGEMDEIEHELVSKSLTGAEPIWVYRREKRTITIRLVR